MHDDEIHAIYVDVAGTGTVHYITDQERSPYFPPYAPYDVDTGLTLGVAPLGAGPIKISIFGFEGDDTVDLWLGAPATEDNLGGFPLGSVSKFTFWGNEGDDTLNPPHVAALGARVILPVGAAPPNIYFNGGDGDDTLFNGMDPELFDGGLGQDQALLAGGLGGGNDVYIGRENTDKLEGGADDDRLDGGHGSDHLYGGGGVDTISGGTFGDWIVGGDHSDIISGGADDDEIQGDSDNPFHSGNDRINGDAGNDLIFGGNGKDIIQTGPSGAAAGQEHVNAPGGPWFEIVFGEDGGDIISAIGAGGSTYLDGAQVADLIFASDFADTIYGGSGWDTVFGFDGDDTIHGDAGNDEVFGGDHNDTLWGDDGCDLIWGENGTDTLHGGLHDDEIWSGSGVADQANIVGTGEEHHDLEDGVADGDAPSGCDEFDFSAFGDFFSADVDGLLNVSAPGVLANDRGTNLSAELVTNVQHGTLTLNSNGSFSYTGDAGFAGVDSFEYRVDNGAEESEPATVMLLVWSEPPVAVDDFYSGPVDGAIEIDDPGVLGNDDGEGTLEAVLVVEPAYGSVMLNSDGSFDYEPADDFTGVDSFSYRIESGSLVSNIATVTLVIYGDDPIAQEDYYAVAIDGELVVDDPGVLVNDAGDGSLTAELVDDVASGTLTLNSDGSFSYEPDYAYQGTDSFTYLATNGTHDSEATTVTIIVYGEPPTAIEDSYQVTNGYTYESDPAVTHNDSYSVDVVAILVSPPEFGEFTFYDDGTFDYTTDTEFVGLDYFSYVLSDGYQLSNVTTVTIEVFETLALDQPATSGTAATLTLQQLLGMADAAAGRWLGAGVSREALNAGLANLKFEIVDLPGALLGASSPTGRVLIDINAAGYGWFIDVTPGTDREFQRGSGSQWWAVGDSPAVGYVDLLTVLEHEMGHLLGLHHAPDGSGNVMEDTLGLGERRLPTARDAAIANWLYEVSRRERRR